MEQVKAGRLCCIICLLLAGPMAPADQSEELETVKVVADEEFRSPLSEHSTFKSERVSQQKLKAASTQSLADAVATQVGVDTQTYCANCGAKRLTINGMKGEHTSILIDGLPLHSAVSSFYGVDSIPVTGLSEINVMRGAGASLVNPEAIGGTLDLITVDPLHSKNYVNLSTGLRDGSQYKKNNLKSSENYSFLSNFTNKKKTFGTSFGGQYGFLNYWDEDSNNVAEAPERTNYSVFLKSRYILNKNNDLSLRVGFSELDILGGTTRGYKPSQLLATEADENSFIDGDIRKPFVDTDDKITDYINLKRYEIASHWTHYISKNWLLDWNTGYARQEQRSLYQHGFDYANNDDLFVTDLSTQFLASDSHLFKVGLFYKWQDLRSTSLKLFSPTGVGGLGLPKDSFNNQSFAAYLQDTYTATDHLTIEMALRLDSIHLNWDELNNEINKFIAAPRLQVKHDITHHLSQRFSYGLGYRSPLTYFESQHGNNETGYIMGIDKLETAHSFVYSLSQNTPDYYATISTHYTILDNMAYGQENGLQEIIYRNFNESVNIWVSDLMLGAKITSWWFLEGSYEIFTYEDKFKDKLPTAAIENRLQINSEMNWQKTSFNLRANFVGNRDLSKYGNYPENFNVLDNIAGNDVASQQKNQTAPSFITVDSSFSYKGLKPFTFTLGVNNIFDYTQVRAGNSPTMWHWHINHAHFDNLHTWGPNRGREYYLQVQAEF